MLAKELFHKIVSWSRKNKMTSLNYYYKDFFFVSSLQRCSRYANPTWGTSLRMIFYTQFSLRLFFTFLLNATRRLKYFLLLRKFIVTINEYLHIKVCKINIFLQLYLFILFFVIDLNNCAKSFALQFDWPPNRTSFLAQNVSSPFISLL